MALKRKPSLEELIRENREKILQDKHRLAQIDQNIEIRMQKVINKSKKNA